MNAMQQTHFSLFSNVQQVYKQLREDLTYCWKLRFEGKEITDDYDYFLISSTFYTSLEANHLRTLKTLLLLSREEETTLLSISVDVLRSGFIEFNHKHRITTAT